MHNAGMITRLAIIAMVLLAWPALACERGPVTDMVSHVRDGDTIELGALAIRLDGLAAPERDEPGGDEATAAMRQLVDGRTVTCVLDGEATYDRCVAVCYLAGSDIAETMVSAGLARDCPRYSGGLYQQAEQAAVAAGATIGQTYPLPGYCRPR